VGVDHPVSVRREDLNNGLTFFNNLGQRFHHLSKDFIQSACGNNVEEQMKMLAGVEGNIHVQLALLSKLSTSVVRNAHNRLNKENVTGDPKRELSYSDNGITPFGDNGITPGSSEESKEEQ
jgi:hypothetical protein